MSSQAQVPVQQPQPSELLMQMATGYMAASAVYVTAKLNIADLLRDGPRPVSELAEATGVNENALYRVLRALTPLGIFTEVGLRYFALTPAAELLAASGPNSLRDLVLWMSDPFHFRVYAELMHSVQTGQTAVEHVTGMPIFDYFDKDHAEGDVFHAGMTSISTMTAPAVLDAYDFSGIRTLVDVAGGHGYILAAILQRYPQMQGVIFDLPHVARNAEAYLRQQGLDGRCRAEGGDFFECVPAGDAFILQHIIHDWDDPKAHKILANIRQALEGQPQGRLLLLEAVIPAGNTPHFAKFIDVEMLAMAGGRERTEREYRALLSRAGFKLRRVITTPVMVDVIEAVPE